MMASIILRRVGGSRKIMAHVVACASIVTILTGCANFSRIAEIGSEPKFSPMLEQAVEAQKSSGQNGDRVTHTRQPSVDLNTNSGTFALAPDNYAEPVGYAPSRRKDNSLWQANTRSFFGDQRARSKGDIVTIMVNIADNAKFANSTAGSRLNSEDLALNNLAGYGIKLVQALPTGAVKENLVDLNTSNSTAGNATIDRSETLSIKVAATVLQVLPNGNLVLKGRQEVRVNAEMRELQVTGIVRPSDISSANTIDSSKIAEARIAYGGRGYLQGLQQPRYGQQLLDAILPF